MGRYRRKQRPVEAVLWTGENGPEVRDFMRAHGASWLPDSFPRVGRLAVTTAEGEILDAVPGDWIIAEAMTARFRPCTSSVFEDMYEAVDDGG
jgi:hypothetical protein